MYDRLAERYLDKVMPETRQGITEGDMKRYGIDPAMLDRAQEITARMTRPDGTRPTIDQVVAEMRREDYAKLRRGI